MTGSWPVFWIFVLGVGTISAMSIWYIWGWWYRLRLRWSGATTTDGHAARLVLIFATAVWSVPSLASTLLETLLYPDYRAAWEADPPWAAGLAFIMLVFPVWSIIVSYRGVRARFDVRPRAAQAWFLLLPLTTYGLATAIAAGALLETDLSSTVMSTPAGFGPVSSEAEALHDEARRIAGAGRYREALPLFTKAMELAPRWPQPVYDRAFTYLLMNDAETALADYRRTHRERSRRQPRR